MGDENTEIDQIQPFIKVELHSHQGVKLMIKLKFGEKVGKR